MFMLLVTAILLSISNAQMPTSFMLGKEFWLIGHTGNSYELQSSTDLVTWYNQPTQGAYFKITSGTSYSKEVFDPENPKKYFRARPVVSAQNFSYNTPCGENDNVMFFFRGDISQFSIKATHPTYTVTDYTLWSDFTDCLPWAHEYTNYSFTSRSREIVNGGVHGVNGDTVLAKRENSFWRPQGMTITVNGNQSTKETNMHSLTLHRYIPDSHSLGNDEYPSFFVLYCDGNMRLIPFPPIGHPSVSYGSSVIIGPTENSYSTDGQELRPLSEIESVDYRTQNKTMLVTYRSGGTAILDVNNTTRTQAVVKVTVNYPTDKPFCTFRSNYVSTEKCDTSTYYWKDFEQVVHINNILSLGEMVSDFWFFTRSSPSVTRNSSPDILFTVP